MLGLAVERSRCGSGSACFTQTEDFHLEHTAVCLHFENVGHANFARRLDWLAVGLNSPQFASSCGERASLKNRAAQSHLSIRIQHHPIMQLIGFLLFTLSLTTAQQIQTQCSCRENQQNPDERSSVHVRSPSFLCRICAQVYFAKEGNCNPAV